MGNPPGRNPPGWVGPPFSLSVFPFLSSNRGLMPTKGYIRLLDLSLDGTMLITEVEGGGSLTWLPKGRTQNPSIWRNRKGNSESNLTRKASNNGKESVVSDNSRGTVYLSRHLPLDLPLIERKYTTSVFPTKSWINFSFHDFPDFPSLSFVLFPVCFSLFHPHLDVTHFYSQRPIFLSLSQHYWLSKVYQDLSQYQSRL